MADYFDVVAGVGSDDDDDESFDEETGEVRSKPTNGINGDHIDDSSEEDDEDDDEEAIQKVREGFIVEEDDDDEEVTERRRRKKSKRRREEREEEGLDDEDLDLIGELELSAPTETKYKRLKRGHKQDDRSRRVEVDDIFADDNEDEELGFAPSTSRIADPREFDDFIEQDEPDDLEQLAEREVQVGRPRPNRGLDALNGLEAGLDEATLEDMNAAFGDGSEYIWALDLQEDEDLMEPDKALELKDVFEPSQLVEKRLTDEDNLIRIEDVPERLQLARLQFPKAELDPEEVASRLAEESEWITNMMFPKKRMDPYLKEPFRKSVEYILRFINIDNLEIPFIFFHRKDYLIHPEEKIKLLTQDELWEIFDFDHKFRAMIQKRSIVQRTYDNVKNLLSKSDKIVEALLPAAVTSEEVQDIQDYVAFQYAGEIKDTSLHETTNGQKRSRATAGLFERVRAAPAYRVVQGFGVSPDDFARDLLEDNQHGYTDDPQEQPDDMADACTDSEIFRTGEQVLKAAKATFAEELAVSPRMRKYLRGRYYADGLIDCVRTEKGLRQIDEDHKNYEFKYLRNQTIRAIYGRPELFLRMLKAEADGLVEVRLRIENKERFRRSLHNSLISDNLSELADAWNALRKTALDEALAKLEKVMVRGVKETLRVECEKQVAMKCREEYSLRLDQAPYATQGAAYGVSARVLTMTNGRGTVMNKDAIHWAYTESDGKLAEHGTFIDLRLGDDEKGLTDAADVETFRKLVERRRPDVIGVSGFTPETKSLQRDIQAIIDRFDLRCRWDEEGGVSHSERLNVIIVNDEVARLYYQSDRAKRDAPSLFPLTRYCIALARYMHDPLKEYAALGRDILSVSFHPDQSLLPLDKLMSHLESAMIDMVNLAGVDINEAAQDEYVANLVPYLCGLGPRKATSLLQAINRIGGQINNRMELTLGGEGFGALVGPKVFENCISSMYLIYDAAEDSSNFLDNTRIHPEDYDLAKKIVSDAMDLDEEDAAAEVQENGPFAIVRRLVQEDKSEDIDLLDLESYARDLIVTHSQRKRATLETIRAELKNPYEELRHEFVKMGTEAIFTMLTGETRTSLQDGQDSDRNGMVVPVTIRKIFNDHIDVRLDCGIDGGVSESEYPNGIGGPGGVDPRQAYRPHQTVQAKLLYINHREFKAQLSLREDLIKARVDKGRDREPGEWDDAQEEADKRAAVKRTEGVSGRAQRVIKHPLFRPFNSKQAEEFLGPQGVGDVVIRPSSKGLDHLAVTWKVANNVYQHIDVLELDKENEFSVGRTLKIGGKYTYSDLDELIVNHVQSMARKVDEISHDERWNRGTKAEAEEWCTSYMEANPTRSIYAFCINPQYPGYFNLCFKFSQAGKTQVWPLKVIPNGYELQRSQYPDVSALKNGFKVMSMNKAQAGRGR